MTWLERQRFRAPVTSSGWLIHVAALGLGMVAFRLLWLADRATQWSLLDFTPDGARAMVATLAAAMVTFVVFLFSIMLIAVQLVSTSMSPRIITLIYKYRPATFVVGLFVFTFVFTTSVLGRIDETVPQLCMFVALVLSVLCVAAFVMVIDGFGKHLRPVAVLSLIGAEGVSVLSSVYPDSQVGIDAPVQPADTVRLGTPERVVDRIGGSGIVVAFHAAQLEALAERADCTIELVPQVGDFVAKGDPLFHIYGAGASEIRPPELAGAVAFGVERSFAQDPLFAFRICVDVAAKALSPAINDPTTAVLAIDQLHHLLRTAGRRRLDSGIHRDAKGRVRLVYRTPDWEDFVRLAVTEIRHYGIGSIQVVRRLRAMLENLASNLPPERAHCLELELQYLSVAAERAFPDAQDCQMAAVGDSQGLGSPAARLPGVRLSKE